MVVFSSNSPFFSPETPTMLSFTCVLIYFLLIIH